MEPISTFMHLLPTFGLGFGFSFVGAIPIAGPVSALVVRKVILGQEKPARWLAYGAALPEAFYAGLAAFGIELVFSVWPGLESASHGLTIGLLLALGAYFLFFSPTAPQTDPEPSTPVNASKSFWTGFSVSAVNLSLLATWSAAWTVIKSKGWVSEQQASWGVPLAFALGVFGGISAWFSLAVAVMARSQQLMRPGWIRRLMQAIGLALLVTGMRGLWMLR